MLKKLSEPPIFATIKLYAKGTNVKKRHPKNCVLRVALRIGEKIVSVINNIFSVKKWGIKKIAESDFYSFAEFVNNAQFHTGECAVNYGAEGGLRNAAFE